MIFNIDVTVEKKIFLFDDNKELLEKKENISNLIN